MATTHGPITSREQSKKTYVFGSSTPRELSHIGTKVNKNQRLIQTEQTPKSNLKENGKAGEKKKSITYYMRQARSMTPAGTGGRSTCWAFGSSTPRELSHLNKIRHEQRIYDAKISHKPAEAKSSQHLTTLSKPPLAPKAANNTTRKPEPSKIVKKRSSENEDASSEPDIVQDRAIDFHQRASRPISKPKNNRKSDEKSPVKEKTNNIPNKTVELKTPVKIINNNFIKHGEQSKIGEKHSESQNEEKLDEFSTEVKRPIALINETHYNGSVEDVNLVHVHGLNIPQHNASAVFVDDADLVPKTPEKAQQLDTEKVLNDENESLDSQKIENESETEKKLQEKNIFVHKLLDEQQRVLEQQKTQDESIDLMDTLKEEKPQHNNQFQQNIEDKQNIQEGDNHTENTQSSYEEKNLNASKIGHNHNENNSLGPENYEESENENQEPRKQQINNNPSEISNFRE